MEEIGIVEVVERQSHGTMSTFGRKGGINEVCTTTMQEVTYEIAGITLIAYRPKSIARDKLPLEEDKVLEDYDASKEAERHLRELLHKVIYAKHAGEQPGKEGLEVWDRMSSGFLYGLFEEEILYSDDNIVMDTIRDEKIGEQ